MLFPLYSRFKRLTSVHTEITSWAGGFHEQICGGIPVPLVLLETAEEDEVTAWTLVKIPLVMTLTGATSSTCVLSSRKDQIFKDTSTRRTRNKTTFKNLSQYISVDPDQSPQREVNLQPHSLPHVPEHKYCESDCPFFSACRRAARILHTAITPPVIWEKSSAC